MANELGILRFDAVEFYVGSAKPLVYWFQKALGFECLAYKGPQTGEKNAVSYLLKNNHIHIVITAPLNSENYEITSFISRHGEGVKRMYYYVTDVEKIYNHAILNKAKSVREPHVLKSAQGVQTQASILVYDDTEIVFVNRQNFTGLFEPHFEPTKKTYTIEKHAVQLHEIDHIVGNVRVGEMNTWADFFNRALKFETFIDFGPGDISTPYSALLSKVVRSSDAVIRNPINEPYQGLRKSQIQEFLDVYQGSGIQHIALSTHNIIETISAMRKNGVEFLSVPKTYYTDLRKKNIQIDENLDDLEALGILCDVEDLSGKGYLLQLFTKPIFDRPSFFFEIIQRKNGSEGFGKGNFKALFEAIERDQLEREGPHKGDQ